MDITQQLNGYNTMTHEEQLYYERRNRLIDEVIRLKRYRCHRCAEHRMKELIRLERSYKGISAEEARQGIDKLIELLSSKLMAN